MFDINHRIIAFNKLGIWIKNYIENKDLDQPEFIEFNRTIAKATVHNKWFTKEHIYYALKQWAELLTQNNLEKWLVYYSSGFKVENPKTVGVIMAGNLPLVGFHDFLTVLISGFKADVKLSTDDDILLPALAEKLIVFEPAFKERIVFSERLKNMDAVIATGSNNTARYFESYFGKYPNIIRKSRSSVAVLTGTETEEDLQLLADDLFLYFGLGCRSITKIYLPKGFKIDRVFESFMKYSSFINHNKYMNNYEYYRAIYLLDQDKFLENGFAILKEEKRFSTPVGVIHYSFYNKIEDVKKELEEAKDQLQCVVAGPDVIENAVSFGDTQKPSLNEYADNINTLDFLKAL